MSNPFEILDARLSNIETMLLEIRLKPDSPNHDPQEDEVLDVAQTAKLTKLAKQTIYTLSSTGKLPHYKGPKKIWFLRSEILAWIKSNKKGQTNG